MARSDACRCWSVPEMPRDQGSRWKLSGCFSALPPIPSNSDPQRIIVGDLEVPLPGDGLLRLAGADTRKYEARIISAVDIVNNKATERDAWPGPLR